MSITRRSVNTLLLTLVAATPACAQPFSGETIAIRARYPPQDKRGRCSFEQLVDEHFPNDSALKRLALIVHSADFPKEIDITPESAGLWAISQGFGDKVAKDDAEIVERASFIYDSLLVHLRRDGR